MDFKKTNGIIRLQVILFCFVGNDLKGIIGYIKKKKSKLVSIFKAKKSIEICTDIEKWK